MSYHEPAEVQSAAAYLRSYQASRQEGESFPDSGDFCLCTGFRSGLIGGGSDAFPPTFGGDSVGTPGDNWMSGLGGSRSDIVDVAGREDEEIEARDIAERMLLDEDHDQSAVAGSLNKSGRSELFPPLVRS